MKQLLNVTFIITVSMKSVKPLFNYQGALLFVDKIIIYWVQYKINSQINQQYNENFS